jgi:Ran GTPase-activating protein (RanGAP) involved in mRNA processing and transport
MTERGAYQILKRVQLKNIRRINLSDNSIGERCVELLVEMIGTAGNQVEQIALENTGLTNRYVAEICESLQDSRWIKELNLSRNKLSDSAPLGEFLAHGFSLEKLDLHWN